MHYLQFKEREMSVLYSKIQWTFKVLCFDLLWYVWHGTKHIISCSLEFISAVVNADYPKWFLYDSQKFHNNQETFPERDFPCSKMLWCFSKYRYIQDFFFFLLFQKQISLGFWEFKMNLWMSFRSQNRF